MSESDAQPEGLLGEREAMIDVAKALWAQLPDECDRIVCEALMLSDYAEYRKTAYDAQGGEHHIGSSYPVIQATEHLRKVMYRPGSGTWYTGTFVLERPGKFQTQFDYEGEPAFTVAPTTETYADDAEAFPRDDEHLPEWMRARLGE